MEPVDKSSSSMKISMNIKDNIDYINCKFTNCPDIIRKKVIIADSKEGYFIYVKALINVDVIQRDFIKPILAMSLEELYDDNLINKLSLSEVGYAYDLNTVISEITNGNIVFVFEGSNKAISYNLTSFQSRNVTEPVVEKNNRGPHEGFIETLDINISILRRIVKNHRLKFKSINVGATCNQQVVIGYIEGIANEKLIDELYQRISSIDTDALIGIGALEQLMKDKQNSPFPLYIATERPDKVVAGLLEGQLAIILDGNPVVLLAPVTFFSFFQALDDYASNWFFGSLSRFMRFIAAIIAVFLPAIYIMITSFHYYIVPLNLLIPLAESRAGVPFPPIVEALIMEFTIEMIRESAVRLPTYMGGSVSVVGGLVIGQAAVQAKLVSSLFVIIVAVTAIASYLIPNHDMAIALRIIRFIIMILAAVFGIGGVTFFISFLFAHLVGLESLGQPYFQPLIPIKFKDLKDAIIRVPTIFLKQRPDVAKPLDGIRGKKK